MEKREIGLHVGDVWQGESTSDSWWTRSASESRPRREIIWVDSERVRYKFVTGPRKDKESTCLHESFFKWAIRRVKKAPMFASAPVQSSTKVSSKWVSIPTIPDNLSLVRFSDLKPGDVFTALPYSEKEPKTCLLLQHHTVVDLQTMDHTAAITVWTQTDIVVLKHS